MLPSDGLKKPARLGHSISSHEDNISNLDDSMALASIEHDSSHTEDTGRNRYTKKLMRLARYSKRYQISDLSVGSMIATETTDFDGKHGCLSVKWRSCGESGAMHGLRLKFTDFVALPRRRSGLARLEHGPRGVSQTSRISCLGYYSNRDNDTSDELAGNSDLGTSRVSRRKFPSCRYSI